ncbi:MAG: hypothetical protein ACYDHH_18890 [Solirubrobacteraceae bacterium]
MTDERTITAAIDLAEQLLDEVTRAEHDWAAVAHLADALARLAAAAARGTTATPRARRRP